MNHLISPDQISAALYENEIKWLERMFFLLFEREEVSVSSYNKTISRTIDISIAKEKMESGTLDHDTATLNDNQLNQLPRLRIKALLIDAILTIRHRQRNVVDNKNMNGIFHELSEIY